MKNDEWNNLRTKLHHDWLQNRYLTFLMARAAGIDETLIRRKGGSGIIVPQWWEGFCD